MRRSHAQTLFVAFTHASGLAYGLSEKFVAGEVRLEGINIISYVLEWTSFPVLSFIMYPIHPHLKYRVIPKALRVHAQGFDWENELVVRVGYHTVHILAIASGSYKSLQPPGLSETLTSSY